MSGLTFLTLLHMNLCVFLWKHIKVCTMKGRSKSTNCLYKDKLNNCGQIKYKENITARNHFWEINHGIGRKFNFKCFGFIDQLHTVECFNTLLKLPLHNGGRTRWFASFGSKLALCFQICFPTLIWLPVVKCYASGRKKPSEYESEFTFWTLSNGD